MEIPAFIKPVQGMVTLYKRNVSERNLVRTSFETSFLLGKKIWLWIWRPKLAKNCPNLAFLCNKVQNLYLMYASSILLFDTLA